MTRLLAGPPPVRLGGFGTFRFVLLLAMKTPVSLLSLFLAVLYLT
jgi:hypothetical protein